MTKYNEMTPAQKHLVDACYNGWYMGGRYRALLGGHQREFFADTVPSLAREIAPWYAKHEQHHSGSPLLVKCVQAL